MIGVPADEVRSTLSGFRPKQAEASCVQPQRHVLPVHEKQATRAAEVRETLAGHVLSDGHGVVQGFLLGDVPKDPLAQEIAT
jgi:hypothetical protein